MASLPTGTVTVLFTDIEGSTQLLQRLGDGLYAQLLTEHRRLLRAAFTSGGGHEIETQGDAFLVVFQRARDAVQTAVSAQRALQAHPWPDGAWLRVRMGLHTGEPVSVAEGYVGLDLHQAARICSAAHGGQILLSRTTRNLIGEHPPEGIGLRDLGERRLKDLARPVQLSQVVAPDLPADFPPLRSLDVLLNNLPIQLTSFIGREREMAEIKRLLSGTALLTLTGMGGAGKTRLALQVAADVLEHYPDGVWMVDLSPVADPALVPQATASTLALREQPGRSLVATLADYLQNKALLLVVDNCEHVVTACAPLAEALLRVCPHVRILATSREPLGVAGETVWRIPSLSLPDSGRLPRVEVLMEYEAVRLFIDRAVAARSGFALTDRNAAAVAEICHRLDGIPLAIELAAARINALSPEQIADRLNNQFRILTGGSRTAPPRHQRLQAAMDWSYDLLSENERALLRRLSVFAGGFTLEAGEAVCAGGDVGAADVLDLLAHLVDKSLVLVGEGAEVRYRLLDTVRQYARARLVEAEDVEALRRRHRDWYLPLAQRAGSRLWGSEQPLWLERLDQEHGNLRAALDWSLAGGEIEAGLQLAGAIWSFWFRRGYLSEGRAWLDALLARSELASPLTRARALNGAAVLAWRQGDYDRTAALSTESLALFREHADPWGIAWSHYNLGVVAFRHGDYERAQSLLYESLRLFREQGETEGIAYALDWLGLIALSQNDYTSALSFLEESLGLFRELGDRGGAAYSLHKQGNIALAQGDYARAGALHEESLALFRELKERAGVAAALSSLGNVAWRQGDYGRARSVLEEALTLFREVGEKAGIASTQNLLGIVARMEGDYKQAAARHEESLALQRELGDRAGIAAALAYLGRVAEHQGSCDRARGLLQESLTLRKSLGDRRGVAECLEGLAAVAVAQAMPERAAQLLGGAEVLRETVGTPLSPVERPECDRLIAAIRGKLGNQAFAVGWAKGRSMTLEQVAGNALAFEAL